MNSIIKNPTSDIINEYVRHEIHSVQHYFQFNSHMQLLSQAVQRALSEEYLSGKFIFSNFYRQVEFPQDLKDRFGHCAKLCERVARILSEEGYKTGFLTAESFHVTLRIDTDSGGQYIFDPFMGQLEPIPLAWWTSPSFEANTHVTVHTKDAVNFLLTKHTPKIHYTHILNRAAAENTHMSVTQYTPPTDIIRTTELPNLLKIIFYADNKKISLVDTKEVRYISIYWSDGTFREDDFQLGAEKYETLLNLPKNTFINLFDLARSKLK